MRHSWWPQVCPLQQIPRIFPRHACLYTDLFLFYLESYSICGNTDVIRATCLPDLQGKLWDVRWVLYARFAFLHTYFPLSVYLCAVSNHSLLSWLDSIKILLAVHTIKIFHLSYNLNVAHVARHHCHLLERMYSDNLVGYTFCAVFAFKYAIKSIMNLLSWCADLAWDPIGAVCDVGVAAFLATTLFCSSFLSENALPVQTILATSIIILVENISVIDSYTPSSLLLLSQDGRPDKS